MNLLTAHERIFFGGSNLAEGMRKGGTIASVIGTDGAEYAVADPAVVGLAGETLLHIHQQTEIQTGIIVVFVLAQLLVVDYIHYRVEGCLTYPQVFGSFHREIGRTFGTRDVAAYLCSVVAPGVGHEPYSVGGVLLAGEQFAFVGGGVHHQLIDVDRCRHACFVI